MEYNVLLFQNVIVRLLWCDKRISSKFLVQLQLGNLHVQSMTGYYLARGKN